MKDLKVLITESQNSKYTVIHSISGEEPEVQKGLTYEQLHDTEWVTKNIFGDNDDTAKVFCKTINSIDFRKTGVAVFEGDAGYVTVVDENNIVEF